MSTTIRVSEATKERIASLADSSGTSMVAVLDAAVDALERQRFFADFNRRYRELRDDANAWREVEDERASEATVLRDST